MALGRAVEVDELDEVSSWLRPYSGAVASSRPMPRDDMVELESWFDMPLRNGTPVPAPPELFWRDPGGLGLPPDDLKERQSCWFSRALLSAALTAASFSTVRTAWEWTRWLYRATRAVRAV